LDVWDPNYVPVVKIEVMMNGEVQENVSPSFPADSDDIHRVSEKVKQLLNSQQNPS